MNNFIEKGERLPFTAGFAVASGAGLTIGDRFGVATGAVESGGVGILAMCGVFQLPKLSTDVITVGQKVYWDFDNARITTTAASHNLAGFAFTAAGNGATTVNVCINR